MKVAYFAESPADQAALTILTDAILGFTTQSISHPGLRHRGWPKVKEVLPAVLKHLHFHSDADGLVFVVDSDDSQPHLAEHEPQNSVEPACRLCQLRRISEVTLQRVRSRQNLPPLKIALGLAVPAIEAWLLCRIDPHVTEAAWINGLKEGRTPFNLESLKSKLYGTSRPSLPLEIEIMKREATRLAPDIETLRNLFPLGFGALLRDLQRW